MFDDRELTEARWTHIALPTGNLDAAIDFYTTMTPLVVVERFSDDAGESAWLSNEKQVETPMVLVLVSFDQDRGESLGLLQPFAHIGIEVPRREDVDAAADRDPAVLEPLAHPAAMPGPVGYICALTDPDGNVVEFSHGQDVFALVRARWGSGS